MSKKYVCSICGKGYDDLALYVDCVKNCGYELEKKLKKEKEEAAKREAESKKRAEEVNAALNGVKQAKAYLEQKMNEFKEKYPEEYRMNFGATECDCDNVSEKQVKRVEVSVKSDGKGKPVVNATINGKNAGSEEVDKYLNKLLEDTDTNWIAKMLGLA